MRPFDMYQQQYTSIFQALLDKAQWLEENDPEFVRMLEKMYLSIVSGPLAGTKVSADSAYVSEASLFERHAC
jgi:hypothetical protein